MFVSYMQDCPNGNYWYLYGAWHLRNSVVRSESSEIVSIPNCCGFEVISEKNITCGKLTDVRV